ncbi:MAG: membrane dipeptidase [Gammaproteobacteria bacterium]|jgi:microsomal dipeptidase-like Zn-dependent dipeptidase|nr:membrane dipeptidase [Gammaproteobacteria bacterium]MBT7173995.1 membrane dipeptidase [Gammaproteobacteria bacterium]
MHFVDGLQYSNWSEKIFKEMNDAGLAAVHVTIAYHENFREVVANFSKWNDYFEKFSDLVIPGTCAADIDLARESQRTAIFFGFQNPSPIEDDISLVEICYQLGARFMQLSYNNQSLLATGCYESDDPGITRMGRQVIKEMNRIGFVIDMSHSAERSTLEAIDLSERPITISHANPDFWHAALRNKSEVVLKALAERGGMLGFSMYPHHLDNGSSCTLKGFCQMIARTVELIGVDHVGFGSDLCQDQPDSVVEWMRNGRWTKEIDYGEGSADHAGFPPQPAWFENSTGYPGIAQGLAEVGFDEAEVAKICHGNWHQFFERSFGPEL